MSPWHHADIDDKQQRADTYSDSYRADYGFESVMVRVRQDVTLGLLPSAPEQTIVEVGCGTDLLVERASVTHEFAQWVIVEPGAVFATGARDRTSRDARVRVIQDFFEESVAEILETCSGAPAVVICSGLLHEVDDPSAILHAARRIIRPGGQLIANVPNAHSLHRRLAVAMGLINETTELSARNTDLRQPRVLDAEGLASLISAAGFHAVASGGYFLKPFTHSQMLQIPFLDDRMIEGLQRLGTDLPELASEIYVVATPDGDGRDD